MRRICVITGSRADACPLEPVIMSLRARSDCELHHIRTEGLYGHEAAIKARLEEIRPEMAVLLGDRYETLVAATVCALLAIPVAHLSGGDITEGAVDDSFRHAITKLAYWHFPGCDLHAQRIRQMGEGPERIFALGFPAVDILADEPLSKEECARALGIELKSPVVLVCYHPETLGFGDIVSQFEGLLDMLVPSELSRNGTLIVSGANADSSGEYINAKWPSFIRRINGVFRLTYESRLWVSLMHHADYLIGNSSGFIIEGMTLQRMRSGKPEVIIVGDRQKGRYEDAMRMFKTEAYPFGKPGLVGPAIACMLMSVDIPLRPRKQWTVA